ncbi:YusW family protein [Bacillus sp. EB01]|uniref:YusW family protein n=1 Tax=Bacillus sp. EB01 TaxID=1347086 RepID=UPI0006938A9F|nr:YusW family protein [Bacillus sp. EB01]
MDALDISYEKEKDETEASYIDKDNNIELKGNEAMKELDEKFKSFTFNQHTPDEQVLEQVFKAFDLPENTKEIVIEIVYADGIEKEYRR